MAFLAAQAAGKAAPEIVSALCLCLSCTTTLGATLWYGVKCSKDLKKKVTPTPAFQNTKDCIVTAITLSLCIVLFLCYVSALLVGLQKAAS